MSKSLVRQQFGAHAAAYTTSLVHAKGASLSRLVEVTSPQGDWLVLDVATGAGHTAFAYAPHVARIVASDITPEMLEQTAEHAGKRGLSNIETRIADAEALPFPDEAFDLVTCRIAAHHFPDVPLFVSEVRRVLKPAGLIAVVDNVAPDAAILPGYDAPELRDAAITYNAFEKLRDPSHGRCLTLGEWLSLLDDAGLAPTHSEVLAKDMAFRPWVERLDASASTISTLESMLADARPALRAFLRPREVEGALTFTLAEALVVARREN